MELYVHGLASPEEIREVEAMAEQHPEVRQEIDAIQQTLERYSDIHGVQPPDGLKDKIMQRLDAAPKGRSKGNPNNGDAAQVATRSSYEPREQRENSIASVATWILGLALLGACVAVFLFWQQAERANAQLKAAQDQVEEQRKSCEEEKAKASKVNEQFIAIRSRSTKPVEMKGTPLGGDDAFAVVYWNSAKKTALLDVVSLPKPPSDKQFQLWAIVDGKPTDMGVFEVAAAGDLQEVPFIKNPQAFAVTLEPKGGSQSPTLDQMYVVGAVGKT